ncbi:HD domain-containing protein, partial [Methylophilaceae bacterium]|nr:HD domain-containing protein [Methylophilaceae bacterium]
QECKKTKGFGPNLLGALDTLSTQIDKKYRSNPNNQKKFLDIFKSKNKVSRSLRLLNKCNILGKFIPAFGKIVAQMQHDLFHIYTVDEHTLNVIENIRRFTLDKWKHEFPECNQIFKTFKKPYLLYLGALFHDIAKGRGGDHSKLGEVTALRFGRIMKLKNEDKELIAWLVKSHLKMSSVAQKSDLADSSVINEFAGFVKTQHRLDALYLLTVADIRGTSPHVWNQWKASLLRTLYLETKNNLNSDGLDVSEVMNERKEIAHKILSKYSIDLESYSKLWVSFNEDYFSRFDGKDIAWHTRVLLPHSKDDKPVVKVRHGSDGQGIEVLIFTKDAEALFAKITNFFYDMKCEIVQATITTTKNHYALDVFNLIDIPNESISYKYYFHHIEKELTNHLLNKHFKLNIPVNRKIPQVKYHKFDTKITCRKIRANRFQLEVVCASRPNLLGLIVKEIYSLEMSIHNAKINTLGQRAEDFFIISSKIKLNLETRIETLIKNIKLKVDE